MTDLQQSYQTRPELMAFNVWLSLVDELLDKKIPLTNAMLYAGQRLHDKQEEYRKENEGKFLFHPVDLYRATEDINLFLRRRPEYEQRKAGWAEKQRWNK